MTILTLDPVVDDGRPRPHVSAVMAAHNRADLLRSSARMILDQTLRDLELIVCDDHSTDHTPQVVRELMAADSRVRYHRPPAKGGLTGVMNAGIPLARGRYIQLCHDHDIYLPTMLEKMSGVMDRNPGVMFVHPGRQGCDYLGHPLPHAYFVYGYPEVTPGAVWKKRMLTRLASPVTALSMIRRSALERIGLFDPGFGGCSDVDIWMRLCEIGDVGYVRDLIVMVRGREPGHQFVGANWELLDQGVRVHRKHLPRRYHGGEYLWWRCRREAEIDLSLLFDFLNSIRHGRTSDVTRGRRYLKRNGVLLSRVAAYLL